MSTQAGSRSFLMTQAPISVAFTKDARDVLLEGSADTPGEPTDLHTVEDIQPGNRPDAGGDADEPDVQNSAEEEGQAEHPSPDRSHKDTRGSLEQDIAQRDEANNDGHSSPLTLPQHRTQVEKVGEDSEDKGQSDATQLQII